MSSNPSNPAAIRIILLKAFLSAIGIFLIFLIADVCFPLPDQIDFSKVIVDRNGQVLHAFLTKDQQWRMKTDIKELSPLLRKTILFKEDQHFYYHPGVDPLAIARAAVMNVLHLRRTSGASTITMQVARMLEPRKRSYGSKLIEIFRAFQLEWKYSKEEILQLYFSLLPYGSNIQGVKSASVLLFQKSPNQLSLAEVTALSIIPNRPTSLELGKKNSAILPERNKWLKRFGAAKLFSEKEIAEAMDEPLKAYRHNAPQYAPHLSLRLSKNAASTVQSTIKLNIQLQTEKLVANYLQPLRYKNISNAAVIILNNQTHEVLAYVGSADFANANDGGQVDGIRAERQPGSTLKPLLYGLCIDNGLLTPKTVLHDVPLNIKGFVPENFDEKFRGYVSMDYALCNSLNIPAVKALNDLGKEKLIQKLVACNFKAIQRDSKKLGLSMILGGCGVTLEELTALFSSFANNGVYQDLRFRMADSLVAPVRVLSPSANYMITEMLSRIARPDLPINWEASAHTPRIAWKTGTSYGRRDAWSIGFNRKFTVGVWIGNFNGHGSADLSGAGTATPLLFKIFNSIDYNSENDWFKMPKECGIRLVCSETGKLPNDFCKNTVMDYFIPMVSPNRICDNFKLLSVSSDERFSYCRYCEPENGFKRKYYEIVPPDMKSFFQTNHIPFPEIPPHHPQCDRVFEKGAPAITFPIDNMEYYIDKNDPQPLALKCETDGETQWIYWYVNNKFFRKAKPSDKVFFVPEEGNVKISCADDRGRNSDCHIRVKHVKL